MPFFVQAPRSIPLSAHCKEKISRQDAKTLRRNQRLAGAVSHAEGSPNLTGWLAWESRQTKQMSRNVESFTVIMFYMVKSLRLGVLARESLSSWSLYQSSFSNSLLPMSHPACPECTMEEVLEHPTKWECVTCGCEWSKAEEAYVPDGPRVVKDAYGTVLADGDCVTLIKDLKLRGSTRVLKGGSKSKPIRLVEGDHQIDCKIDGEVMSLKAEFVRKA